MTITTVVFAIHNHQPTGNYDDVVRKAFNLCYLPFIRAIRAHPSIKIAIHFTGCLLEWMESNERGVIDEVAEMVSSGQIEILGGGWQEPMLSAIPVRDGVGQLSMMRRECARLFGTLPEGMWLAERVWEPELPQLIASCGYRYTFVDDTHLRYSGIVDENITGYYITEKRGASLAIFPISKPLRYSIPFKEPEDILRILDTEKGKLWVYGDDGEKFGIWPGSSNWVWEKGWMERFLTEMERAARQGRVRFAHPHQVLESEKPSGRIYMPTCSYHEMGEWALPAEAGQRFEEFEKFVEESGQMQRFISFVTGGTWANFLSKYGEANLMHKKMIRVSEQISEREKASPPYFPPAHVVAARRYLYRGQTNCPYWHGLFGGLYLPHLRKSVYRNLISAQRIVSEGSDSAIANYDFDTDGHKEILIEGEKLNIYIKPSAGGSVFEIDSCPHCVNITDVLMRRRESYHREIINFKKGEGAISRGGEEKVASIHEIKRQISNEIVKKLKFDAMPRYSFQEMILKRSAPIQQIPAMREILPEWIACNFASKEFGVKNILRNGSRWTVSLKSCGEISEGGAVVEVEKVYSIEPSDQAITLFWTVRMIEGEGIDCIFTSILNLSLPAVAGSGEFMEINFGSGNGSERLTAGWGDDVFQSSVSKIRLSGFDLWDLKSVKEENKIEITIGFSPGCGIGVYPVETISQSEAGYEAIYQGSCIMCFHTIHLESWNEWKGELALRIK